VDDLIAEIRKATANNNRVLVTTLTKRTAEDLSDYLANAGIKVRYLHSEIDAIDRVEILRNLRLAQFDVLVSFLRSERSLIQTAGRAARNRAGTVILYADKITDSMKKAIAETNRRRQIQIQYNKEHDIEPETIYKSREEILRTTSFADSKTTEPEVNIKQEIDAVARLEIEDKLAHLMKMMNKAAKQFEFEKAAILRDEIAKIKKTIKGKK